MRSTCRHHANKKVVSSLHNKTLYVSAIKKDTARFWYYSFNFIILTRTNLGETKKIFYGSNVFFILKKIIAYND